ncbi:Rfx1p [Saccharomyces eubayanus]|uniref:Rfx1p n=1 Tax=Saccharomyces eubayanus TaxID=1080349 RepID=UPI0006BF4102|nr:RFX1-like protein [Saccharomyces eubayanus]KOG97875.1 RFX1-like protein [Saccharomyces eubayanus]
MPVSGDNSKDPASRDPNDDSNGPGNGSSMNNNQYSLNAPKYNSQPQPASHTYLPPMSVKIPPIATKPSSIYSLLHQSSPRPESPNPILPPLIGSGSNSHIPSPTPAQPPPPPQPPHSAAYSMYPSSISLNRSNSSIFPLPFKSEDIMNSNPSTVAKRTNTFPSIPDNTKKLKTSQEKRISSISRRNTQEIIAKQIAESNKSKTIEEYAQIVKHAEIKVLNMDSQTTSKASLQLAEQNRERERQVFALLWLMKNCKSQHDSYVPRGKIFAQYASSCSQNNLKPLSQASLGKLIRTVFPDLTTRRLGMRGQSKYHYCGLKIATSENGTAAITNNSTSSSLAQNNDPISPLSSPSPSSPSPTLTAVLSPSPSNTKSVSHTASPVKQSNNDISNEPELQHNDQPITNEQTTRTKMMAAATVSSEELSFADDLVEKVFGCNDKLSDKYNTQISANIEPPLLTSYKLEFPNIPRSALPAETDADVISSLESLYHVHCNSVYESIKFLKTDTISNALSFSNSNSISPTMFNLFTSEPLIDWVTKCDLITYTELIKFFSQFIIHSNEISDSIIQKLETVIKIYPEQINKAALELPKPLVQKKLTIINNFIKLLKKLIKLLKFIVNFLRSFPIFKNGMNNDWQQVVNLEDILDMMINEEDDANSETKTIMQHWQKFCQVFVTKFLNSSMRTSNDPSISIECESLNQMVKDFCYFISEQSHFSCLKLIDCYTRFRNALIGDISLKSSENLLSWLFLNNVMGQLLNYCFEVIKFINTLKL